MEKFLYTPFPFLFFSSFFFFQTPKGAYARGAPPPPPTLANLPTPTLLFESAYRYWLIPMGFFHGVLQVNQATACTSADSISYYNHLFLKSELLIISNFNFSFSDTQHQCSQTKPAGQIITETDNWSGQWGVGHHNSKTPDNCSSLYWDA